MGVTEMSMRHGQEMRLLGLQHALRMAEIYQLNSTFEEYIEYLKGKVETEESLLEPKEQED